MYSKYLNPSYTTLNSKRFNFKAVVTCDYYHKLGSFYKKVILEDIDLCYNGRRIGILKDSLVEQIKSALNDIGAEAVNQIIENFQELSYSEDYNYISIEPDFIIQNTGLQSKNKLRYIYEGDIVRDSTTGTCYAVVWDNNKASFYLQDMKDNEKVISIENSFNLEVIGNIFQNIGSIR